MSVLKKYNFRKGEVLLVDKPLHWTSFDVVNKLRYPLKTKYNIKRFKVGHAGTLDPLATGLLVICTGKMTKEINAFVLDSKEYTGVIQLGATTPSYDLETEIDATFPTDHIDQDLVNQLIPKFSGTIKQVPPIYSAKKVEGKRAYDLARKGIDVELKENEITIIDLELKLTDNEQITFKVNCEKGTYIRSLANDIGKALNSGGHLIELRRTRSGRFTTSDAKSVEQWVKIINDTVVLEDKI
ncbi:MAG: tRNA pseudouridine(55) synthase TruB [Flavobacteriales bacterium]|nr:tRNA pseudouridine(55) synthase TruB [Flavobacteriales bacterium]